MGAQRTLGSLCLSDTQFTQLHSEQLDIEQSPLLTARQNHLSVSTASHTDPTSDQRNLLLEGQARLLCVGSFPRGSSTQGGMGTLAQGLH